MRTLHTDKIIEAVKEMCISANLYLADDMDGKIRQAAKEEDSTLGKQILNQLIENMEIAGEDKTPICQDTGMAVFFVNVGQNLHIEGMNLTDAINEGVRRGYTEGYLRKSVVKDRCSVRIQEIIHRQSFTTISCRVISWKSRLHRRALEVRI